MRLSGFDRYMLTGCLAMVMLVGCGGSQPPIGAPGAAQSLAIATRAAGQPVVHPNYLTFYSKHALQVFGARDRILWPLHHLRFAVRVHCEREPEVGQRPESDVQGDTNRIAVRRRM